MRKINNFELWQGHAGDLRDIGKLSELGIKAVVEVADNEPSATLPRQFLRHRFPLSDDGENSEIYLSLAWETLLQLLKHRIPTIVVCSAGMSRSLLVIAASLSLIERIPFPEVLKELVREKRADISPALFHQIHAILNRTSTSI